jgi:hypothetical protein
MSAANVPPLPRIDDLCRAARDYVQRATGCRIDTSEESLAFVDHYLTIVRRGGPVSDEALALLAAALGAHLGQVAIAKFGGSWHVLPEEEGGSPADPATWRVTLADVPLSFDPIGMAACALRLSEVEGYDASLTTRSDLAPGLAAALGRVPPVEEEYFYSLTGRLETIAYAADFLAELLRPGDEPTAAEPA